MDSKNEIIEEIKSKNATGNRFYYSLSQGSVQISRIINETVKIRTHKTMVKLVFIWKKNMVPDSKNKVK